MSYCTSAALPAIDGTSALRVFPRRLVLIEGGRSRRAGSTEASRPASGALSASQGARLVLCGIAVVLAVVLASMVVDPIRSSRSRAAIDALPTTSVVVAQGDSLWSIAESCGEGLPTDELVSWIQERNGIEGGLITSGQTLIVPVSRSE